MSAERLERRQQAVASGRHDRETRQPNGRKRPATLWSVALAVGVSAKTVSRVVNGQPGVAAPTRWRVESAIRRLGYQPNLEARSLRRGRGTVLAMAVPSITSPFFAEVIAVVETIARERGFMVVLASTSERSDNEVEVVTQLCSRGVAGLILAPSAPSQAYLRRCLSRAALVCIDRPPVGIACESVLVDNRAGAKRAVSWLTRLGHRRIAFVGGPEGKFTIMERYRGYVDALEEARVAVDPGIVLQTPVSVQEVAASLPHLLMVSPPISAIFSSSSKSSLGVIEGLRHYSGPEPVVVGFDEFPASAVVRPPVSVVRQDAAAIGREAFEAIMGQLDGKRRRARTVVIPTDFVPRMEGIGSEAAAGLPA